MVSTQLVRNRLALNLRCFPTSSLAFSLAQVRFVGFLTSTSVMGLVFSPLKTEKRVEERDMSWVHQPPLFLPAAFTHLEAQVHSLSAAQHFKSSQCICRGFLQEFYFHHL